MTPILATLALLTAANAQSDAIDLCVRGDAMACEDLDDTRRVQTQLEEQCREAPSNTCFILGHLSHRDGEPLSKREEHRVIEACDAMGDDCGPLARAWLEGEDTPQDLPLAMVLLERACWNDDGAACTVLAEQEEGRHGRRNEEEITERYRKGCRLDQADACLALARRTREGLGTIKDPLKTTLYLDAACKLGADQGCWDSGKAWATGDGVPKDQSHGWDRLREACVLSSPRCIEAAEAFRAGEWLFPEANHIIELYDLACQQGELSACWTLHDLLVEGKELPAHPFRAALLRERACEDEASCEQASRRFVDKGDPSTARQILDAGCQVGHSKLCWELVERADEAPADPSLALRTLDHLCEDLGDEEACTQQAVRVIEGVGIKANPNAGWILLKETCRAGYDPACVALIGHTPGRSRLKLTQLICEERDRQCWHQGALLLQGSRRGYAQAIELLERSCAADSGPGCVRLAQALEEGRGVEADPARAATLRAKACELGVDEACAEEEVSGSGRE